MKRVSVECRAGEFTLRVHRDEAGQWTYDVDPWFRGVGLWQVKTLAEAKEAALRNAIKAMDDNIAYLQHPQPWHHVTKRKAP